MNGNSMSSTHALSPTGQVHAVKGTRQPGPSFNYELFNCNNFNMRCRSGCITPIQLSASAVSVCPTDWKNEDSNTEEDEDMVSVSCPTPLRHPTPKSTYDRLLTAPVTRKPSEVVLDQEKWVKLFYARYLNVTATELAITFGTNPLPLTNSEEHKSIRNDLARSWRVMRPRSFGLNSYLSELIQHKVEFFDF
jgi:hypothetical protein